MSRGGQHQQCSRRSCCIALQELPVSSADWIRSCNLLAHWSRWSARPSSSSGGASTAHRMVLGVSRVRLAVGSRPSDTVVSGGSGIGRGDGSPRRFGAASVAKQPGPSLTRSVDRTCNSLRRRTSAHSPRSPILWLVGMSGAAAASPRCRICAWKRLRARNIRRNVQYWRDPGG